ncbi:PREDICTED: uncharacterized protein LOC109584835 isoform X1 [Amphimedon queenslandica]|uniref:Uncharacterized protein n=1 Tax=Amphimedon queenslandica TaxID=400682 RepID=A0AAN0JHL3_AMPQE|nr:PREDICTED: uncharacterized protein LOC109584835 isoform X1 [Amphimedon queenslandica]|eukprot:XP_019856286.1 PREDICTED: uncharacterized protein LOC109584835 isoform X1 [Amphimedon queenslandica]
MGFVVGALFLLSLSFGAILTANDPMPPKIPETFSSWYFFLDVDNQSTIISSDEGYIARDVLGKRALQTGTTVMSGMFYSYSYLDILNKNASYETIWDSDGNRTCYIYDNDSPGLMPMWDWIQNATYIGSDFNEDIWMYYDDSANVSMVVSVPSNNPIIPLELEIDGTDDTDASSGTFSGFDPNYSPVDDDFDIPTDCEPVGKGGPPPIHFLPYSLHSFRSKEKIHHHMKMNHMKPLHGYKKIPNMLRKRMKKLRK